MTMRPTRLTFLYGVERDARASMGVYMGMYG